MEEKHKENPKHSSEEDVRQFVEAQLRGEQPDLNSLIARYPDLEEQIRRQIQSFQCVNSLFDALGHAQETEFEDQNTMGDLLGQRIGKFEIEKVIGRGGMGVVYLARDTKLDRSVAIKRLPPELQASSTARTRFTREAKLLASLSHPNIGVIHDIIEPAEGSAYLVLEYVPGETLAQRMAQEPLRLKDALSMSLQIAEAVCAAHEEGVIHRDLKPSNIKITPDGRVKVLDFGLAKTAVSKSVAAEPTVTQAGRVMGTPAYMSPEQARGKPMDRRTDIWSFGCLLYEMLTGHLPFEGETTTDILARIIEREPDWNRLPPTTPSSIRVLLRRCLAKEPRRRLQHMGDAVLEIDETLNLPAAASPVTISSATVSQSARLRRLIAWGAVCLLLGAIAASLITWNLKRSAPPSQPTRRYIIRPETDLSQDALWMHALALSPDGRRLAYVEEGSDARRRIYLRELDKFEAKPLPATEGAISPFFSPDGQWLGYVDHHQRKLKKVSLKGGQPIVLCESVQFRGGTWGTNDTIIFAPSEWVGTESGLWRISASGEGLEQLTVPDPNQRESGHLWPQILPGGKAVLFTNPCTGGRDIEIYSLETGHRHKLFKGGTYARYVPTGHIVYARANTLYAVRFDVEQLKVVGSAVPIIPEVMTGGSNSAQFAISRDGSLAYIPPVTPSTELRPVWVDRQGQVEPLPAATPRNYNSVRISPDGTRLAFGIRGDVWIYDLTRHTLNPLTSDGSSFVLIWAPDGKGVLFWSTRSGKFQLFRQSVAGSDKPELLATLERNARPTCCSPDGKELLLITYDPNHPKRDRDISVVSFEKQNEKPHLRPFTQRNNNQRQGVWSPDGRWIAYNSDETGRWEVYVEAYPGPGQKVMISTEGGYQPVWSRDGKELFYRSGRGSPKMVAATIETEPEFRVIESKELFETINFRDYDVAPDGRFLMIQEPQEPTPFRINVVTNWFEELKHLAPQRKE